MKMKKFLTICLVTSCGLMTSVGAYAGKTYDAHGNVGYDTAQECAAAIASGSVKFYQPSTRKSPLKRKGEVRVVQAKLRNLGEQYTYGACDIGAAFGNKRDGVSAALNLKFIPFSPDMPINVYLDAKGNAVRVTMAKSDGNFSGVVPRPAYLK